MIRKIALSFIFGVYMLIRRVLVKHQQTNRNLVQHIFTNRNITDRIFKTLDCIVLLNLYYIPELNKNISDFIKRNKSEYMVTCFTLFSFLPENFIFDFSDNLFIIINKRFGSRDCPEKYLR